MTTMIWPNAHVAVSDISLHGVKRLYRLIRYMKHMIYMHDAARDAVERAMDIIDLNHLQDYSVQNKIDV